MYLGVPFLFGRASKHSIDKASIFVDAGRDEMRLFTGVDDKADTPSPNRVKRSLKCNLKRNVCALLLLNTSNASAHILRQSFQVLQLSFLFSFVSISIRPCHWQTRPPSSRSRAQSVPSCRRCQTLFFSFNDSVNIISQWPPFLGPTRLII